MCWQSGAAGRTGEGRSPFARARATASAGVSLPSGPALSGSLAISSALLFLGLSVKVEMWPRPIGPSAPGLRHRLRLRSGRQISASLSLLSLGQKTQEGPPPTGQRRQSVLYSQTACGASSLLKKASLRLRWSCSSLECCDVRHRWLAWQARQPGSRRACKLLSRVSRPLRLSLVAVSLCFHQEDGRERSVAASPTAPHEKKERECVSHEAET